VNVSERLPFDQMQSQSIQTCDEFVSGNYGEQQKPIDKEKKHEN